MEGGEVRTILPEEWRCGFRKTFKVGIFRYTYEGEWTCWNFGWIYIETGYGY
jgi:hypothetical protein